MRRLVPMTTNRQVVIDSLGVGVATGAYGISFGALATASGLTIAQACALSLLLFSGASQFAFISVLGGGGAPVSAVATAFLLSSRNAFYGIAVAPMLKVRGWKRFITAQVVIDESTAMTVVRSDERQARIAFFVTGFSIFVLWNLMTLIGAIAGEAMGDPKAYGLDAAVSAAFLALLWPRLTSHRLRAIATLSAILALGMVQFVPVGFPIIIAGMLAVSIGMMWGRES